MREFCDNSIIKNVKRAFVWLFIVLVLLSQVSPVYADEAPDGTIELTDTFYVTTTGANHSLQVPFNRSWFRDDARKYNHDLAKLSLGLATSAFRASKSRAEKKGGTDYNVRSFLDQAGFTDLRSDDYNKDPSMYTVSSVIGHQTISDGDDSFELIAVGICGQGYMDEWESNLSVGTGKNPEGFFSAAHLVYDRVFGYISEKHLEGEMKIWVSGFSRAAAVSNITATLLSDSNVFSQKTVFAYTFGTPMTVRDKEPKLYENIFNICGKMDPVTNVPFADWGYSRYGITYFTPTMETDSDFWDKRKKADVVYEEITGISYWTNADMNSQLRVLMDCLLKICPDVESYHDNLQEQLISLWEKHDFISIMIRLLKMADDPILINDENRLEANLMMNQITYLLYDYVSSENSFRRFNQKASVSSNIMQAHTPELYVSWIFSVDDPDELYTDFDEYTQLYVTGDAVVSFFRDDELLESLEAGDRNVDDCHYLGVRDDKISVLIPHDRSYRVSISSNRDQTVTVFDAGFQIGRHAPDMTLIYTSDMKTGDVIDFGYVDSGRTIDLKDIEETSVNYQTEQSLTSIDLLSNVYSYPDGMTWRDLALLTLMGAVLLITTVLFIISLLLMYVRHCYDRNRGLIPKNFRFRPLPIVCAFLIQQLFLAKEFYTALYDHIPEVIYGFKMVIGALALIIAFYGYRRKKNSFHLMIIYGILLLNAADIMMTISVSIGALLYIGAYILLCVNFSMEERPGKYRIMIWIILSAAGILFMRKATGAAGYLWYIEIIYMIAGAALVVTGFTHSARTARGTILLFAAGILMILNLAKGEIFAFHLVSAALHYIAVCILASTGSGVIIPRIVPEYSAPPVKEMA